MEIREAQLGSFKPFSNREGCQQLAIQTTRETVLEPDAYPCLIYDQQSTHMLTDDGGRSCYSVVLVSTNDLLHIFSHMQLTESLY